MNTAIRAKTRILVVGHDESTGAMLANSLDCPGFDVQTAPDGGEALTMIDERPDVLVIDATSSGVSHWDLSGSTPIVALSTRAQLKEVVARDGVWVCLVKPVKAEVLVGAVKRIADYCSSTSASSAG